MFTLNKKLVAIILIGLLSCPISSYASVIPNPLSLDSKCYFVKGYKKTKVVRNSQFTKAIKRIAQLEGLISYLSLVERPTSEICKVDNEDYLEIKEELNILELSIYKAVRSKTRLSKTKKRKAYIKDSVTDISSEIAILEERITDLDGLMEALRRGETFEKTVSGVDNTDIHEVMATLWSADRYKAELENRLVFWEELKKRFRIK